MRVSVRRASAAYRHPNNVDSYKIPGSTYRPLTVTKSCSCRLLTIFSSPQQNDTALTLLCLLLLDTGWWGTVVNLSSSQLSHGSGGNPPQVNHVCFNVTWAGGGGGVGAAVLPYKNDGGARHTF